MNSFTVYWNGGYRLINAEAWHITEGCLAFYNGDVGDHDIVASFVKENVIGWVQEVDPVVTTFP